MPLIFTLILLVLSQIAQLLAASLKQQHKDKGCPDQTEWIFAGVLFGLVSGTGVLWLLNCFNISEPGQGQESTIS